MERLLCVFVVLAVLAGPVSAAGLIGIWQTESDGKEQTGHVQITPCGLALCGTVISAYDRAGKQITTASVGRQIIRDVQPRGANNYGGGTVYVPLMKAEFPVEMTVNGNTLDLRACNRIGVCRRQTWTRVK